MASLTKIKSIFDRDRGGSYSNEYEMNLIIKSGGPVEASAVKAGFIERNFEGKFQNMLLLCDEAQLPGSFAATNEIDGIYTGRMIQYAHGRLYNDMRLSFIQTNELNPQKFFESWFSAMFPEFGLNNLKETETFVAPKQMGGSNRLERSNIVAIEYHDDIVCDMIVTKTFKDNKANNGGESIQYRFVNVYPYSIESVPLSYGASTLNKLRVAFRYEKHVAVFNPD